MTQRELLASGLQKHVGNLWKSGDLKDFTVVVDDTQFKCHRFILSACSGFFQSLFNSQMKEQLENCVTLKEMTKDTFDIIINALYTGIDGLTNDNVLDVWSATHLLQIDYLTEQCQKFVMEKMSVENCFPFLNHATLYAAQDVIDHSLDFISRHFAKVNNVDSLLDLPFDYFYKIVKHDNLAVDSEELVLDAILKWVEYTPRREQNTSEETGNSAEGINDTSDEQSDDGSSTNSLSNSGNLENIHVDKTHLTNDVTTGETNNCLQSRDVKEKADTPSDTAVERNNVSNDVDNDGSNLDKRKQHLLQLLSACRLFTIKSNNLDSVMRKHARLFSDTGAHLLMHEALMYTLNPGRRHDTWPEAAVHRASSSRKHVMVFVRDDKVMAYSLSTGRCAEFVILPEDSQSIDIVTITIFDNILYLLLKNDNKFKDTTFNMLSKEKTWVLINSIQKTSMVMLLPHDDHIYMCCLCCEGYRYPDSYRQLDRIWCVYGHDSVWSICGQLDSIGNCLVRFHKYVLVFMTRDNAVTAECYNTETQQTHKCTTIMDGSSEDMISFINREDVYLLQRNGSLWKVFSTDKTPVDIELVSKLWDFDCSLKGCVLYKKKLFIFCGIKPDKPTLTSLPRIPTLTSLPGIPTLTSLPRIPTLTSFLRIPTLTSLPGIPTLTSLPGIFTDLEIINIDSRTQCLPMVLEGC